MDFKAIIEVVILLGSAAMAISHIASLFGKPIGFMTKKAKQREERKKEEWIDAVVTKLQPEFDHIKEQNDRQTESINKSMNGTKNLLRKGILDIYKQHKKERKICETERDVLEDLYKDYKALGGNHYIDHVYARIEKWEVVPDDD